MTFEEWSIYKSEQNKKQGPKGAVIGGLSTIAGGAAAETLDLITAHFGFDLPPYLKLIALASIGTVFGYYLNRLRNWMKYT